MSFTNGISRREFLRLTGLATAGAVLAACGSPGGAPASVNEGLVNTADDALARLKEGNARYVAGKSARPNQSADRRAEVAKGQKPWAAIWGCIDSRVPPELVFDRGLGDLFVIRTAGQVIDNAALGSLEFAVEEGVKLIVVLGHQSCGAVKATIETLDKGGHAEGQIDALVKAIQPAVDQSKGQPGDRLDNAVRANVAREIEQLKSSSEIIAHALKDGKIKLVGARYDLEKGTVDTIVA